MFQTCFECGRRSEVLQSHPLPISPLLQTPDFYRFHYHIYFEHSLRNLHMERPKHQTMSSDSKTGWAPIRCIILRSLSEAQQRYFAYRATLAAIVSHHVHAGFNRISHTYRAICCKIWAIVQMCLCETMLLTSLRKYRTIWGIAARVSQYRHIRNYYLSNSKTFQDGNGNGNFEEIDSNDFLDGNWESMEMKG